MTVMGAIAAAMLLAAIAISVARALKSTSLADRAVALDLAVIIALNGLALRVATARDTGAVDLLLIFGLVGFITIVTVARFIERRGD